MTDLDLDALERRAVRIKDEYGVMGGPFSADTILELIRRLRAAERDTTRLDSGMLLMADRDEFGEAYNRHIRGLNLRQMIDAAIDAQRGEK